MKVRFNIKKVRDSMGVKQKRLMEVLDFRSKTGYSLFEKRAMDGNIYIRQAVAVAEELQRPLSEFIEILEEDGEREESAEK